MGDFKNAKVNYKKAICLKPGYGLGYQNFTEVCDKSDKAQRLLIYLNRALFIIPNSKSIMMQIGNH